MSGSFRGHDGVTTLDLGYKMPEDVTVRVWDDANANGLQDDGEVGISDAPPRLVLRDNKNMSEQGNGGYAQEMVESGDIVKFTKVPRTGYVYI